MTPVITRAFMEMHPFVLTDGRRFKAVRCAAHTVVHGVKGLAPVVDYRTSRYYDMAELMRIYGGFDLEAEAA